MVTFLLIVLGAWAACLAIWWFVNNVVRKADIGRIKSRIVGAAAKKEKTGSQKQGPALIEVEDKNSNQYVAKMLHRFQLRDKLVTLLEQAGLKWSPAKLANACLTGFLIGFGVGCVSSPSISIGRFCGWPFSRRNALVICTTFAVLEACEI